MGVLYSCGDEERRALVRQAEHLNGIESLEVLDSEIQIQGLPGLAQRVLVVRCMNVLPPDISKANVRIEGGVRITSVGVGWASRLPELMESTDTNIQEELKNLFLGFIDGEKALVVCTNTAGDFSTYTLRLVDVENPDPPYTKFDPRLSAVSFSFKVECPSDFDCTSNDVCPPPALTEPRIDYLAKDYASFRRLLFDRLSATAPQWRERNPADLGVALVELMAYVGDHLSYFQDAVATEAYLGTARRRVSVRRHARLTDYFLHEGANARTWLAVTAGEGARKRVLPGPDAWGMVGTPVLTRTRRDQGPTLAPEDVDAAQKEGAVVFETLADLVLHPELGQIRFHTWSDRECCLPAGATAATLVGNLPVREKGRSLQLQGPPMVGPDDGNGAGLGEGDFLLFEEVLGPRTGAKADADPRHRHVVRLTSVRPDVDLLDGTPVVEITWDPADALPFPLCLSGYTDAAHGARYLEGISVARGNLVPADHGLTRRAGEALEAAPEGPASFEPQLKEPSLTFALPLPEGFFPQDDTTPRVLPPAVSLHAEEPSPSLPRIHLEEQGKPRSIWVPRADLLESGTFAQDFVVEMEEDRTARLRFGDGDDGRRPLPGTELVASYRVGGGLEGNLGADVLVRVATDLQEIVGIRNPLPAAGGRAPEPLEEARQYAPQAFRQQRRAVTEADYALAAERHPEVARAAATFRWTGSWRTVFVTVDRIGGGDLDADFEEKLRRHLGLYRLAGYDLEVDGPRFVPLDLELSVCLRSGYHRSDVRRELERVFSNRRLPDGSLGHFHPDRWTFGQAVYLSPIVAAASGIEGVASVVVSRFQRRGRAAGNEIDAGVLPIHRLEIARLDNDRNLPENGLLRLVLGGGV